MPGTVGNFITTILLTLTCSIILFIAYRIAIRPILMMIPLQNIQRTIADHFSPDGHVRLPDDDDRRGRNLEEGFRDDSDDEEGGDARVRSAAAGV